MVRVHQVNSLLKAMFEVTLRHLTSPPYFTILKSMVEEVGNLIRSVRKHRGWTLRDLSGRCNLSVGFLSQVERGLSSLGITSLNAICNALGISLSEFFTKCENSKEALSLPAKPTEVIKAADRPYIQISSTSIKYQFLSGEFPGRLFEIMIGEFPPHYHYPPVPHEGEEFGFVLEGRLKLKIGKEIYDLGVGDSYHFLATTPHGYETDEQGGARVLWVQTLKYSGIPFGLRNQFPNTAQPNESGKGVDDRRDG